MPKWNLNPIPARRINTPTRHSFYCTNQAEDTQALLKNANGRISSIPVAGGFIGVCLRGVCQQQREAKRQLSRF